MTKIQIDKHQLVANFQEQLNTIKIFARLYDEGEKIITKDLAVKYRVLFHQTDESKSLLNQLKLDHIPFITTAMKYDVTFMNDHIGLCGHYYDEVMNVSIVPASFKAQPIQRKVSFQNWWNNEKIIVTKNRQITYVRRENVICADINTFTRRSLITAIANTDGGAHVADSLKQDYYNLKNNFDFGLIFGNPGDEYHKINPLEPIKPTIRQIASEVLWTFENIDLFNESKLYHNG